MVREHFLNKTGYLRFLHARAARFTGGNGAQKGAGFKEMKMLKRALTIVKHTALYPGIFFSLSNVAFGRRCPEIYARRVFINRKKTYSAWNPA